MAVALDSLTLISRRAAQSLPGLEDVRRRTAAPKLITRYARRMLIENALSDAVRFFHMDALSSPVGLMTLLVIASGLYRLMAKRMRGYGDAQARRIFRDLIDTPADVTVTEK